MSTWRKITAAKFRTKPKPAGVQLPRTHSKACEEEGKAVEGRQIKEPWSNVRGRGWIKAEKTQQQRTTPCPC